MKKLIKKNVPRPQDRRGEDVYGGLTELRLGRTALENLAIPVPGNRRPEKAEKLEKLTMTLLDVDANREALLPV